MANAEKKIWKRFSVRRNKPVNVSDKLKIETVPINNTAVCK